MISWTGASTCGRQSRRHGRKRGAVPGSKRAHRNACILCRLALCCMACCACRSIRSGSKPWRRLVETLEIVTLRVRKKAGEEAFAPAPSNATLKVFGRCLEPIWTNNRVQKEPHCQRRSSSCTRSLYVAHVQLSVRAEFSLNSNQSVSVRSCETSCYLLIGLAGGQCKADWPFHS